MERFFQLIHRTVDVLKWIGSGCLVGMMLLTCLDVIFRAFGRPILGAVELVSLMATSVIACAMPYTHAAQGHVGVDLLVRRLKPRSQAGVDAVTSFLSLGLFLTVAWRMSLYAGALRRSGEVSMTLELPSYVLVYGMSLAFAILGLVVLQYFITSVQKAFGK
ncbi:MAG: TRAP transporter small permease [Deltaproteobacteria bacterium]|nr:TRAP transporter small permease [Deltaproteobacteria bacterium]